MKIKESEKIDKNLDLAREQKKKQTMEPEGYGDTTYSWCTWDNPQRVDKRTWK